MGGQACACTSYMSKPFCTMTTSVLATIKSTDSIGEEACKGLGGGGGGD